MIRRAKIVCTLGPSSNSEEKVRALVRAGMDVARLNFSHGSHESHARLVRVIRAAAEAEGRQVAILQDLPGPKIRLGVVREGAELTRGERVAIEVGDQAGGDGVLFTDFEGLPRDVSPGDPVLLDDGMIVLEVETTDGSKRVECRVVDGGPIKSRKGINLPASRVSVPSFTEQDRRHLEFGLEAGVDLVALSFVRGPEEVREARGTMAAGPRTVPIIAKIEKPQAIERLGAIIEEADGVMVARGDLGVEMEPYRVPVLQKAIIEQANALGKIVITATQMLESMVVNRRPTRAEASDVANAVFDGTDALMLSGETASGAYPVEAAAMMASIVAEAERYLEPRGAPPPCFIIDEANAFPNAIAKATAVAARELGLAAIVVFTESGRTAGLLSDYRPPVPIIALSPSEDTCRRLAIYWGVTPVCFSGVADLDALVPAMDRLLTSKGLVRSGCSIAITAGLREAGRAPTNMLHLHQVSEQ